MKKVSLGENIKLDIQALIDTRMLVQANSGGGKSYAIRKLLEETHGKVQQVVLDIEGDFSSLREKYDYVIAGKGGDIVADPRSAELLAVKILELEADVIVDLYELKQHERIQFVKKFIDSMVNAPKNLWHPVLLILDEAHIFCPEKGSSEAMGSVIDICTRGRKRGFCAVLATQRISKLHKDAAAECNNKLIGRTGLDIDIKRAADELGLPANKETTNLLRNMKPGQFYVFGPAISREVTLGTIGNVQTTHAKAGQKGMGHKPPASASIKSKLAKLADLPEAAAEEIRDRTELRSRIKDLEKQLKIKPVIKENTKEFESRIDRAIELAKKDINSKFKAMVKEFVREMNLISDDILGALNINNDIYKKVIPNDILPRSEKIIHRQYVDKLIATKPAVDGDKKLGACETAILGFLASQGGREFNKVQVAAMTGYSHGSGGFNNSLSKLNQSGLIVKSGANISISMQGTQWIIENGSSAPHRLEDWINKLGACEKKIYELVLKHPGQTIPKEEVAAQTDYSVGSGGFNNAISRLNTLGLIKREQGAIRLNDDLVGI